MPVNFFCRCGKTRVFEARRAGEQEADRRGDVGNSRWEVKVTARGSRRKDTACGMFTKRTHGFRLSKIYIIGVPIDHDTNSVFLKLSLSGSTALYN